LVAIGILYKYFVDSDGGCAENTWVISLTLLAIIGMTAIQLSSSDGEGSLLTSSVMSLYATYLCFSIVSHNPNGRCNPRLGQNDSWGIVIGLFLTTVSLAWTGWSWSAEGRLSTVETVSSAKAVLPTGGGGSGRMGMGGDDGLNLDLPFLDPDDQPATGVVTSGDTADMGTSGVHVWKLNVVMALISCYVAMILTGWGTIAGALVEASGGGDENSDQAAMNAANPMVGRVNMAILGISQWLAIGLYCWTLVAPRLFPDRDFS
jgi:serine incorporator 1/3